MLLSRVRKNTETQKRVTNRPKDTQRQGKETERVTETENKHK